MKVLIHSRRCPQFGRLACSINPTYAFRRVRRDKERRSLRIAIRRCAEIYSHWNPGVLARIENCEKRMILKDRQTRLAPVSGYKRVCHVDRVDCADPAACEWHLKRT